VAVSDLRFLQKGVEGFDHRPFSLAQTAATRKLGCEGDS
jgi:hypothetical protein